jgi:hypothetical protein
MVVNYSQVGRLNNPKTIRHLGGGGAANELENCHRHNRLRDQTGRMIMSSIAVESLLCDAPCAARAQPCRARFHIAIGVASMLLPARRFQNLPPSMKRCPISWKS